MLTLIMYTDAHVKQVTAGKRAWLQEKGVFLGYRTPPPYFLAGPKSLRLLLGIPLCVEYDKTHFLCVNTSNSPVKDCDFGLSYATKTQGSIHVKVAFILFDHHP